MKIPPEAVGTMLDLDALYSRPRPRHGRVLARRLRRQRQALPSFLHVVAPHPITEEQAADLRQRFTKSVRTGIVVTSPNIEVRRIR